MNARRHVRLAFTLLCTLVGAVALLALPAASASAVESFGGGVISDAAGVAVDQSSGVVYVASRNNNAVDEFSPSGSFVKSFGSAVPGGMTPGGVAVNQTTHDVYVSDIERYRVERFTSEGAFVSMFGREVNATEVQKRREEEAKSEPVTVTHEEEEVCTQVEIEAGEGCKFGASGGEGAIGGEKLPIAVGPEGDVWFGASNGLERFNPEGVFLGEVKLPGAGEILSFAFDAFGDFYVRSSGFVGVHKFEPDGAPLYTVDASGKPSDLAVDPLTGDLLVSDASGPGSLIEFDASGVEMEVFDQGELEAPSGQNDLAFGDLAGHIYYGVYGVIQSFVAPEPGPIVYDEAAKSVGKTGATFSATIDPEGSGTTYHFQYVDQASFESEGGFASPHTVTTPESVSIGEDFEEHQASFEIAAGRLTPGTTYRFRVVATNADAPAGVDGEAASFETLPIVGIALTSVSDVASTSATLDAELNPFGDPTTYVFQYLTEAEFQADGESFSGPDSPGVLPQPEGLAGAGKQALLVTEHLQGLTPATVYRFRVVARNVYGTETSPVESFVTQRQSALTTLPDGRQWELVSPPDKHGAYIYPFTELGFAAQASVNGDAMTFLTSVPTESEPQGYVEVEQVLAARGPDGWVSRDISTPHERATGVAVGEGGEYVAFSEDLSLAVVQPHGFFDPSLSPEASAQTAYLRTNFVNGNVNDPCVESCYRPLVTGKPGYANVPPGTVFGQECEKEGAIICGPRFTGATPDLSHIALSSGEPLLGGQNEDEGYEWFEGKLSRGIHLPASPSEGGSWNYYVSGTSLYVSHGGVTKLIAVVSKVDLLGLEGELRSLTFRVSPDGRWFAFMSQRELTGYNTHDAVSGQPDEEVYLYHAPEDLATEAGTLVCASCDPTGARPVGVEYDKLKSEGRGRAIGEIEWNGDPWIAANVPGWTPNGLRHSIYQSRYLSNGGRLFFDSNDALVPQDVNGNEDVYEYEPVGYTNEEGGVQCANASATFSERSGGCVDLISSGQDPEESAFMDASGSGGDVFFMTAARLVPQDYDTAYDVYDAHECTSAAPCFPTPAALPPPCETGDSCKPAPTPQPAIYGAPSSETFSGPGNVSASPPTAAVTPKSLTRAQKLALALKACHSRRGRRRGACERQARARYGARKSSRAAKKGRG
jgi:DNA-binding beta-propeller fold protein YncE